MELYCFYWHQRIRFDRYENFPFFVRIFWSLYPKNDLKTGPKSKTSRKKSFNQNRVDSSTHVQYFLHMSPFLTMLSHKAGFQHWVGLNDSRPLVKLIEKLFVENILETCLKSFIDLAKFNRDLNNYLFDLVPLALNNYRYRTFGVQCGLMGAR